MSLFGWSRKFEQYQPITDVPERVRKAETLFWCHFAVAIVIMAVGLILMLMAQSLLGLFLALVGVINMALVKLWAHIRLATYQIIMELQARDKK